MTAGVLLLLGAASAVSADTADVPVDCVISEGTLSCPLPPPVTVTETVTSTVAGPTVTVTASATPTAPATTTAASTTAPSSTTAAPTTTVPAGCGPANTEGGADPWGGCWPGPGNTGVPAGTSLTVVNGNQTYSTANATIEGKDIRGCVAVTAPGVTFKNSKVSCPSGYGIDYYGVNGTRLTIQDVTVVCTGNGGTAIGETNVNVVRANISGCENGFDVDRDASISDTYVHDLYQGGEAHTDGVQSAIGTNLLIQHNTIYANQGTSAIIVNMNQPSCCVDTTISKNLMAGGGYTIYCPKSATTRYAVTDNVFSKKFYPKVGFAGPATDCGGEIWSGNIYADNGQPVPQG